MDNIVQANVVSTNLAHCILGMCMRMSWAMADACAYTQCTVFPLFTHTHYIPKV